MSPILRDIKDVFDEYKGRQTAASVIVDFCTNVEAFCGLGIEESGYSICDLDPFQGEYWMHLYLFPEILQVDLYKQGGFVRLSKIYPCDCFDEDEVLRIMAEHGLL